MTATQVVVTAPTAQKRSFPLTISSINVETAYSITFIEEIVNGKLHF